MKKEGSVLVYDKEFDLVMKEEEDQDITNYKILRVSDKKFIMANDQELSLWDLDKEDKTQLNLTETTPSLVELVGEKSLLVADKWIKSYDFYELIKWAYKSTFFYITYQTAIIEDYQPSS